MNKFLALLLLLNIASATAAVYKYVDEQGNIVFSDRKREGAIEQGLSEPSIVPPPEKKVVPEAETVSKEPDKPVTIKYQKLKITNPVHDQVVRNNAGNVAIAIDSAPQFSAEKSHRIIVYLDGKKLKKAWASAEFTLNNVDRGSHQLKLAIIDSKTSNTLIYSEETTFHLQRFSVIRGR